VFMNRILLFVFASFLCATVVAQKDVEPTQMEEVDPNSVYNATYAFCFAKHTDWPEARKSGSFKIAVLNSPSTFKELVARFSDVPLGGQTVEMIDATSIDQVKSAHIVFLGRTSADQLKELVKTLKGAAILIIAHAENGLELGADVNFLIKDNLLRYELNQLSAEEKDITFGSMLIQSAEK
jgi:hypothetical protein